LPAYLKLLSFAGPIEVLAHRILWSFPAALVAVALMGGFRAARTALAAHGVFGTLVVSATLIAINWGVYVWAIANERVIESSLAYFLTPLINVAFGVAFFEERLTRLQMAAMALAALGVAVQAAALSALPWAAIALCVTWSLYGLIRKRAPVPAAAGLAAETLILAAPATIALVLIARDAPLGFSAGPMEATLLALAGPVTAIPLILFTFGARRLRFSTLGLLQYIGPTLQFALGLAWGEPFTPLRAASFILIWAGLVLFSYDAWRREPGT
jgi:chloramphenicol-sensitive protein RarD